MQIKLNPAVAALVEENANRINSTKTRVVNDIIMAHYAAIERREQEREQARQQRIVENDSVPASTYEPVY